MKEVLRQESNSLNDGEKEKLIEKIEEDEILDPDTQKNAIKAVEFFSVDYDDAIKIAEMVNLLWEGKRRLSIDSDEMYFYKTRPQEDVFVEKVFPIAMEYRDIKDIENIPKEIIEDVKDFKDSYEERFRIHKFNQDKELLELFKYVSDKIKNLKDPEWGEVLDKMDLVNYDMETVDRKAVKFPEVWITEALNDYKKKQENIAERKENGFGIRGFEDCEQVSNKEVEEFLQKTFGKELLAKALIAELVYSPKFSVTGEYNLLDEDEFLKLEKEDDSIKDKIVRGGGTLTFNSPSVVDIYNHKHGDISQYKYLDNYSEDAKIKVFILGTIVHEIGGHHFCNKVLKLSERKEYKEICKNEKPNESVTYYVEKHKKGIFFGNIYDEDFSDSMRRFVTDYDEFKNEFSKRAEFIEKKFPEVVKNGIKKFIEDD